MMQDHCQVPLHFLENWTTEIRLIRKYDREVGSFGVVRLVHQLGPVLPLSYYSRLPNLAAQYWKRNTTRSKWEKLVVQSDEWRGTFFLVLYVRKNLCIFLRDDNLVATVAVSIIAKAPSLFLFSAGGSLMEMRGGDLFAQLRFASSSSRTFEAAKNSAICNGVFAKVWTASSSITLRLRSNKQNPSWRVFHFPTFFHALSLLLGSREKR